MKFGIPLNEVELMPITDYRLMLFTCFNDPASMAEFKFQTPEEEFDEDEAMFERFRRTGKTHG